MEATKSTTEKVGIITGAFGSRAEAEKAYNSLINKGYNADDITVLMSDKTRDTHFKDEHKDRDHDTDLGNKSMEGAGVGSAIGGTAGAIIGAIAAAGTAVALPGLGLVLAGPLAAGLAGAGAGGLTGGLIGALVGAGIPKERAEVYKDRIKEGDIVIGVTPRSQQDATTIKGEWDDYNGQEVHYH